ncbi:MAG: replication-associated recombination protein A, partial [Candidatus Vogelbacteria bacterium]|nr:replication-associated recombination protein A [Candidatus Vogelbacteria bacterium]
MDLFDQNENLKKDSPLADRLRPESLDDFVGQEHLIGPGKILRRLIEQDEAPSMILWGPPGTGKTTLARIIANVTHSVFVSLLAVASGVSQLKEVVAAAADRKKFHGLKTILFIDEIHRWNKSQQDALLPYVENGTVTLIGATTENPSFEVNSALLSRARVFVLEQLHEKDLEKILKRALKDKKLGLAGKLKAEVSAIRYLAGLANGDARVALNALEAAAKFAGGENETHPNDKAVGQVVLTKELVREALQKSHQLYDKGGDQHYNIISALHKSLRGSDANAALYWLMRMFVSGEDPLYIARRLVRFASEDVGLANSQALTQAIAGYQACQFLGRPECDVHLAQVVVYLAKCKKSNALYEAVLAVKAEVENSLDEPVPIHLRNAPTKLMKDLGYGKDYKYNPHFTGPVDQDYLPKKLL